MRKSLTKITQAASILLALAFTFGCSGGEDNNAGSGSNVVYGTPVTYGGETYQTVVIGTQTWMARNLNYNLNGSECYDNSTANCAKYGRLYNWEMASTICPQNWHLPNKEEWNILITYVENNKGCTYCAGKYLKATSGWNSSGNGEDSFGFSALPGGGLSSSGFYNGGYGGYWWSASGNYDDFAYFRGMGYRIDEVGYGTAEKSKLFSVRCLKN